MPSLRTASCCNVEVMKAPMVAQLGSAPDHGAPALRGLRSSVTTACCCASVVMVVLHLVALVLGQPRAELVLALVAFQVNGPVLLGLETLDLLFALDQQAQGRVCTRQRTTRADLLPQQRRG